MPVSGRQTSRGTEPHVCLPSPPDSRDMANRESYTSTRPKEKCSTSAACRRLFTRSRISSLFIFSAKVVRKLASSASRACLPFRTFGTEASSSGMGAGRQSQFSLFSGSTADNYHCTTTTMCVNERGKQRPDFQVAVSCISILCWIPTT